MTDQDERRQKPIPTRFDGFRFRSMLEARWAVFFNALDIKYLYEPQGFVTDGRPYLPDFCLLIGEMTWAEVKPAIETDADGVKRWKSFVEARGEHGVLLTDMTNRPGPFLFLGPEPGQRTERYEDWANWSACPDGYHFEPVPSCRFWECDSCATEEYAALFDNDGYRHPKIAAAYELARSYQFDRR
jgi:hypothetical protein